MTTGTPNLRLTDSRPARSQGGARIAAARLGRWVADRHDVRVEFLVIAVLYALYEATRGLVAGARDVAIVHAHDVAALERSAHAFVESDVQRAVQAIPGLLGLVGFMYLTCHLGVTGGVLIWLHRRRRDRYAFYRTTLVLATAISLVGFVVYPTAPPRLSGLGLTDTISGHANIDLNKGLLHGLYNPFAAVPSMHAGYAVIVGAALILCGRHVVTRLVGLAYPVVVVFVIVATGNHFFFDAVTGIAVAAFAAVISVWIVSGRTRAPRADAGSLCNRFGQPVTVAADGEQERTKRGN